jgi:DNA polymerase I
MLIDNIIKEEAVLLQNSLFKNLPKLDENIREKNKAIRDKTKRQTSTSGPTTVRGANKLHQTIQLIKQKASERLQADEGKYLLIRDEETLVSYVDKVIEAGIAGLDTETTGLDTIVDHLVGTCLYAPGLQGCYIPHKHTDTMGNEVPDQISYEIMAREMQRMVDAGVKFVLHNAKFDLRVIVNWLGVWFHPYWCTNIASNFLNENEPHGLKALHDKYVARNAEEDKELNTFNSLFEGISFNYIPIEIGYLYAAKDPKITFELYEFQLPYLTPGNEACQRQGLEEAAKLFLETEMPLVYYLAEMEQEGVYINKEFAEELSAEYREKMKASAMAANAILKTFDFTKLPPAKREKLGGPIEVGDEEIPAILNIGSPTQLAILFYDLLGMKSPDREKPRGTGEEILEVLAARATEPSVKEFMTHILDFRGYKKMLSTYVDKMPAIVKEKTGRLHGSFNQYGAKTGRMSSSDPNLQNIPSRGDGKRVRKMFNAGSGYVLVGSDFSQQEPRVLAHLCYILFGDASLKDAYAQGLDLYTWIAGEVYNLPYEHNAEKWPDGTPNPEGKERRNSVKSIILGLMYGRGVQAVADQLGWSKEKAQDVIDMFFNRFPAIKMVVDYYVNMAREKGFVQTVFGRKRRLPEINLPEFGLTYEESGEEVEDDVAQYYISKLKKAWGKKRKELKDDLKKQGIRVADNGGKIADAERQAMNSVVQGSSADITKRAMVDLGRHERFRELGARMVLSVHDEIIARCPEENALEAAELMSEIMIASCAKEIVVGMSCDAEIIREWAGKDITEELEEKYGRAS